MINNDAFSEQWCKLDIDILSNPKILDLMDPDADDAGQRHVKGFEALGIYISLLTFLYKAGAEGLGEQDIKAVAKFGRTGKEKVAQAVSDLVACRLVYKSGSRIYSQGVLEQLGEKRRTRNEFLEKQRKAGLASASTRKAKAGTADIKNVAEDNHGSTTVQPASNHGSTTANLIESHIESGQESQRESVVPLNPPAGVGPDRPTDDDLPKIPGLKDSQQLTRLQQSDLEKSWGKETVTAYAAILADRVRLGQFTVRQNVYTALSGLLRKAKLDGEIRKPVPPPKPLPCPSVDGSCPKCGAPLRQTSSDGHEWECHSCGTRFTADGGGGWIEEQIGVMARMA